VHGLRCVAGLCELAGPGVAGDRGWLLRVSCGCQEARRRKIAEIMHVAGHGCVMVHDSATVCRMG